MIRVRRYFENGDVEEEVDPEAVSECLGQRGALLWVDVEDPTADDITTLAEEFHVHHLAADDLLESIPRPRLGRYGDHFLLALRDCCFFDGRFSSREVDLVCGDGWLISVRKPGDDGEAPAPIKDVIERFERVRSDRGPTDEGVLLYEFLDVVVDRFFDVSDAVEDRIESVEESIFTDGLQPGAVSIGAPADRSITERLYHLRHDLIMYRRVVGPLREAIGPLLRQEIDFISDDALVHLRDVYDHVTRAVELGEAQRDLLNGALEAHLSLVSNRMNLVMKRATSWGAILVSTTLVTGIYGMNFRHMPELQSRFGYPFALALMAVMTALLYVNFKRRDWL